MDGHNKTKNAEMLIENAANTEEKPLFISLLSVVSVTEQCGISSVHRTARTTHGEYTKLKVKGSYPVPNGPVSYISKSVDDKLGFNVHPLPIRFNQEQMRTLERKKRVKKDGLEVAYVNIKLDGMPHIREMCLQELALYRAEKYEATLEGKNYKPKYITITGTDPNGKVKVMRLPKSVCLDKYYEHYCTGNSESVRVTFKNLWGCHPDFIVNLQDLRRKVDRYFPLKDDEVILRVNNEFRRTSCFGSKDCRKIREFLESGTMVDVVSVPLTLTKTNGSEVENIPYEVYISKHDLLGFYMQYFFWFDEKAEEFDYHAQAPDGTHHVFRPHITEDNFFFLPKRGNSRIEMRFEDYIKQAIKFLGWEKVFKALSEHGRKRKEDDHTSPNFLLLDIGRIYTDLVESDAAKLKERVEQLPGVLARKLHDHIVCPAMIAQVCRATSPPKNHFMLHRLLEAKVAKLAAKVAKLASPSSPTSPESQISNRRKSPQNTETCPVADLIQIDEANVTDLASPSSPTSPIFQISRRRESPPNAENCAVANLIEF